MAVDFHDGKIQFGRFLQERLQRFGGPCNSIKRAPTGFVRDKSYVTNGENMRLTTTSPAAKQNRRGFQSISRQEMGCQRRVLLTRHSEFSLHHRALLNALRSQ